MIFGSNTIHTVNWDFKDTLSLAIALAQQFSALSQIPRLYQKMYWSHAPLIAIYRTLLKILSIVSIEVILILVTRVYSNKWWKIHQQLLLKMKINCKAFYVTRQHNKTNAKNKLTMFKMYRSHAPWIALYRTLMKILSTVSFEVIPMLVTRVYVNKWQKIHKQFLLKKKINCKAFYATRKRNKTNAKNKLICFRHVLFIACAKYIDSGWKKMYKMVKKE